MHATLNEPLLCQWWERVGGWAREREEDRLLQLPFLFCLRDFLGQTEAVTIKPKSKKKQKTALYIKAVVT
jgi:hypothetical protein